ncbi:MAG: alpha/beta hydrolase [Hyphomonadaceae bacterium]|nr:alpha/beta hydrolase [Hyphomonadaceae bacterium]
MTGPNPIDAQLDPEMLPIVVAMRQRMAERTPMTAIAPAAMRERASADFAAWNRDLPSGCEVRDLVLDVAPQALRARLYTPDGAEREGGLLVHFHGGGWVIGDLDFEERACRIVAGKSGVKVLSVDYRLAPETKFPEPVQDCANAIRWARRHARELDVSEQRIAAGGASAGANLAMGATLALRDAGEPVPAFLLLLYGVFAMRTGTPSYEMYGKGDYGLGGEALTFFMNLYLRETADRSHPYASPVLANLEGMPPAYLTVAGMDPLRDDSIELAEALRRAGVSAEMREYPGVIHGFTQFSAGLTKGREALEHAAVALKAALAA